MNPQRDFMNLYLVNSGPYQITLDISISGFQNHHPQIGMPQQQLPSAEYGLPRQFGHACGTFNNNGGCFPRIESNPSILDESYSSGLSTHGIISDSWSYTTPQQIYPHPTGQQYNVSHHYNQNPKHPFAYTPGPDQNIKNGISPVQMEQLTPTPSKGGCFPGKHCAII